MGRRPSKKTIAEGEARVMAKLFREGQAAREAHAERDQEESRRRKEEEREFARQFHENRLRLAREQIKAQEDQEAREDSALLALLTRKRDSLPMLIRPHEQSEDGPPEVEQTEAHDAAGHFDIEQFEPAPRKILEAIRQAPAGLTRSRIRRECFGDNKPAAQIQAALMLLYRAGLVHFHLAETGGRPSEIWMLASAPGDEPA